MEPNFNFQNGKFNEPQFIRPSTGTAGFTLLELLVTIGIIAILVAIAAPQLTATLPGIRLSGAARQVATDLQLARLRAIAGNTSTPVTFNTVGASYTFGSDSRSFAQLFPGITIPSASNPTFTPRGTANAVTITVSNGTTQKYICVKAVGRVNIQDTVCT